MKVKIFYNDSIYKDKIEKEINEWLMNNPSFHIEEILQSQSPRYNENNCNLIITIFYNII